MKNRFAGLKTVKSLQSSIEPAEPKIDIQPDIDNNTETRRRGRPNGKRSNENFRQVTAYINKDVYKQTKMKLLDADKPQEFSELIDALLVRWLQEK